MVGDVCMLVVSPCRIVTLYIPPEVVSGEYTFIFSFDGNGFVFLHVCYGKRRHITHPTTKEDCTLMAYIKTPKFDMATWAFLKFDMRRQAK